MSNHPIAYEQIIAYASGALDEGVAAAVAAHIAGCAACAATVARYRLVQTTMHEDDSPAPPLAVMARAKAIIGRQRPAATFDPLAALQRVVARLTFDSRGGGGFSPALAGLRGGSDGYQLVFEDEAATVDVQVEPPWERGAGWQVMGQLVMEQEAPGLRVALVTAGGSPVAEAEADEHGLFSLQAPAGTYDLEVHLPSTSTLLVLPNVEVG